MGGRRDRALEVKAAVYEKAPSISQANIDDALGDIDAALTKLEAIVDGHPLGVFPRDQKILAAAAIASALSSSLEARGIRLSSVDSYFAAVHATHELGHASAYAIELGIREARRAIDRFRRRAQSLDDTAG